MVLKVKSLHSGTHVPNKVISIVVFPHSRAIFEGKQQSVTDKSCKVIQLFSLAKTWHKTAEIGFTIVSAIIALNNEKAI